MATKRKPKTPEQEEIKRLRGQLLELRHRANDFYRSVEFAIKKELWTYPLDGSSYYMEYLHQRVIAANALGYNVQLQPSVDDNDKSKLRVLYVKKPIPRPWQFDY